MWFCPLDGTMLQIQITSEQGRSVFTCRTCPYTCEIRRKLSKKLKLQRKDVDDILGGAEAWANVDKTATVCPSCSHSEAYFMQMQIRSADEPMSVFYKCCQCNHQWADK